MRAKVIHFNRFEMKYKVGDKVRFLNDVGGGKVTRIEKNTIYVLDNDGFEIPAIISDVILVNQSSESGYSNGFEDPDIEPVNIKQKGSKASNSIINEPEVELNDLTSLNFLDEEKDSEGDLLSIQLAFVPLNQAKMVESPQNLHIINDSPYRVFYSISCWEGNQVSPIKAGFLYPDSKELIKEFARESLNSYITLNIQCIFFKNRVFTPQQPEYYDVRINPTKFFHPGSFAENDFFDERAIIYSVANNQKDELLKTLTKSNINKVIELKDSKPKPVVTKPEQEVEEVDLHINELVDNSNEFTPGQIIEIQMARFKVALEGGIKSKTRKMVFIHGVGNGKLKHELRKELEKNFPKIRYQDASFKEYGYGATIVYLYK